MKLSDLILNALQKPDSDAFEFAFRVVEVMVLNAKVGQLTDEQVDCIVELKRIDKLGL